MCMYGDGGMGGGVIEQKGPYIYSMASEMKQ